ncbi:hypothetical protein SAMN02787142_7752 [Burkholderia sp. WP9]|nr:hypothetical protein [Burkholderia sp. WP9]SEF11715.1 hypothetical protein SAMN02787142_7752 [Burkholderia sp. WP9]
MQVDDKVKKAAIEATPTTESIDREIVSGIFWCAGIFGVIAVCAYFLTH